MIANDMPKTELTQLLQPNETIEQGGIYIAKGIAERTVWDKHAVENPTHAVISAKDEADAREKSAVQIADIKQHLTSNDILLDLGSGYGRVAQYILPEMPLAGYIACDSSYEMLALFRERYIRSDEEQQTVALSLNADIHTIPLIDNSVDVVLVCAVFLHNHKDVVEKSMQEIKRIMKPESTLLVYSSFPRRATAMGIQGTAYQALLNLLGKPFKNGPVRYYSKREVSKLHYGFSQVTIIPHGFTVLPKSIIFLPRVVDTWWRNGVANPINTLLEKIMPHSLKPYFSVHYDIVAKR
jgi:ubiquinone/menaquinone biosynthesis C-methylase UbiE